MIKLDSVSEQTEQGLKPCPFCGGEAIFLIKTYSATGFNRGWEFGVSCRNCKPSIVMSNYHQINTYRIIECPLYEKEAKE